MDFNLKKYKKGSVALIVKPRDIPIHILQTEALYRRLPSHHKNKEIVRNQARNLRTGFIGEESLDFIIRFLPEDKFHILQNLRIRDANGYFQIDTLIVSAYFALIVEIKNIYGTITFDGMKQAIRTKNDGTEEGFNHPIVQVNLQHQRFKAWLRNHHFPSFPLEKVIIYSNTATILRNTTNDKVIAEMIIHKERLPVKLAEYLEVYPTTTLTNKEIAQLCTALIAAHTPNTLQIMEKYEVSQRELLRGVICPECGALPMLRMRGNWKCRICRTESETAHRTAFQDYRLLIGNTIKNKQARDFLKIDSLHVMKRLLMKERFPYSGITSARTYELN